VHLFVSIPPQVRIRRLVQMLKGKTSFELMNESPHLRKKFWGRRMWARGYFCVSSGNVTDEVIAQYIEQQSHDQDSDFRVEGEPRRADAAGTNRIRLTNLSPTGSMSASWPS
jgi:putative transposase